MQEVEKDLRKNCNTECNSKASTSSSVVASEQLGVAVDTEPKGEFLAPNNLIKSSKQETLKADNVSSIDQATPVSVVSPVQTSVQGTNAYKQPGWATSCPIDANYSLEVIKNGIPLADDTVHLSYLEAQDDGFAVSFCVFGRQARGAISSENEKCAKFVTMLHPSISRVHAVLQYGAGPQRVEESSEFTAGWFIYDLNSTHGTFVNKRRIPPNRYIRLHIGYVLRFGSSTRLLILQGPSTDIEPETKESWSELVVAHQKRKAEERMRVAQLDEIDEYKFSKKEANVTGGLGINLRTSNECSWGFDDDEPNPDAQPDFLAGFDIGASCLSHESLYMDDPKRALKNFFEREGIDPLPEYEFVEGRFGQRNCRVELPLDSGTLFAEVPLSGNKRKEAMAACALEACRLLDRLGEFDAKEGAGALKQAREKAYWQKNDYYSSDEDPFLDRTGQLEVRRRKRMRKMGALPIDSTDDKEKFVDDLSKLDSLTVLSRLESLGKDILIVQDELDAAEKALAPTVENASEIDELEAYMNAIKNGAPCRAARQELKRRLFSLRQKELRLLRHLGIRQSFKGAFCCSESSAAAFAVKVALERKAQTNVQTVTDSHIEKRFEGEHCSLRRLLSDSTEANVAVLPPDAVDPDAEFTPDAVEGEQLSESLVLPTDKIMGAASVPGSSEPIPCKLTDQLEESSLLPQTVTTVVDHTCSLPEYQPSDAIVLEQELLPSDDKPSVCLQVDAIHVLPKNTSPARVPESTVVVNYSTFSDLSKRIQPSPKSSAPSISKLVEARFPESDAYDITDPDYALWVPPEDQAGDGIIGLNAKYGY